MRSLASDNNSSVHPSILRIIEEANVDHAMGYGDDPWTVAATALFKQHFGDEAEPFFVFNGTGANTTSITACTHSYHAVISSENAHIVVDECGAPFKASGCSSITIATRNGKLTPEVILPKLTTFGDQHHSQPKVIYISQSTELGTVYTPAEVHALAELAHKHSMYLMMDGARLANACAHLGCSLREITVEAGVDILSFGGTKNGMLLGEAVVCFRQEIADNLRFVRKQTAQLASKMRYLSAQFIPYFENDLWLTNASTANAHAQRLAKELERFADMGIAPEYEVQSNAVFVRLPQHVIEYLRQHFTFYVWDEAEGIARFVCSWDTTQDDVDRLIHQIGCAL